MNRYGAMVVIVGSLAILSGYLDMLSIYLDILSWVWLWSIYLWLCSLDFGYALLISDMLSGYLNMFCASLAILSGFMEIISKGSDNICDDP